MYKAITSPELRGEAQQVTAIVLLAAAEQPAPTINTVMERLEPVFDDRAVRTGIRDAIGDGGVVVEHGNTLVLPTN